MRCIKPNNEQAQEDYDAALVLHQLRCCGITEVARIARAGYPTRHAHAQFAHRYSMLLGNKAPRARFRYSPCPRLVEVCFPLERWSCVVEWEVAALRTGKGEAVLDTCKALLVQFGVKPEQYQIGRTKLFFRAGVLGQLEDAATRINRSYPSPLLLSQPPNSPLDS